MAAILDQSAVSNPKAEMMENKAQPRATNDKVLKPADPNNGARNSLISISRPFVSLKLSSNGTKFMIAENPQPGILTRPKFPKIAERPSVAF